MNIQKKLIVFSLMLIILTGGTTTVGSAFLTLKQTIRQNHERLIEASRSFEHKLKDSLTAIERNLDNFTSNTSTPIKVIATISVFNDPEKDLLWESDYLVEGLYNLGQSSNVDSLAFYMPLDKSGQHQWIYTYSAKEDGIVGLDARKRVSHYTPNSLGIFEPRKATRPNLFPEVYQPGPKYALEVMPDGTTAVIIKQAFINKSFLYGFRPSDTLGYFVMRKKLDSSWEELDRQMGVNFAIYDINGKMKGSQVLMPFLSISAFRGDDQEKTTELSDKAGNVYDSFVMPLHFNGEVIGFLSANIPQSVTSAKIWETVMTLITITLVVLIVMIAASWVAVTHFTGPILKMTAVATAMAEGELDRKIETNRTDELGMLAQAFAKMRDAIKHKIVELEAHDKLKDEFLANTSHELRTPLNGIIGIAESLKDGATGELSEKTKANLSMIVGSGKRLANLVNDILDFSKLKHKGLDLQLTPIGLREMADIVLTLTQPLVLNKPVQLVNAISPDLQPAQADENRLQQILYNLVGNAIKFTENGTVEVSATVVDTHLEITVCDTGIGIEEDQLDRIFESFEQAEGSTAREYGGTGLGLAVTKKLVELHEGNIWVESTSKVGSQFRFTLPISNAPAKNLLNQSTLLNQLSQVETQELSTTTISQAPAPQGEFKILVVDDEPVNLQVLVNHLSLHNYAVTQATSGSEALKLLEEGFIPDLILLDVMMSRMTGYEVVQKIRETWEINELPTLLLTAKNQISDLVVGLNMGANDYLTKPISKDELLARLKTHLNIKRLKAENMRMKAELEVSRRLQQMLLPPEKELSQIENLEMAGFMEPAEEVGGDYYDVLYHDGLVLVGIGDVTGHGLESGALAIMVQAAVRTLLANRETDSVKFFSALNQMVYHNLVRMNAEKSMTLALLFYKDSQLSLSGQHEEMIVVRAGGKLEQIDTVDLGFPIGLEENIADFIAETQVSLNPGDVVVLYTDGITEAENLEGELYGLDRLCGVIKQNWQCSAKEIRQYVVDDVRQYIGQQKVFDDITLLVLKQR